MIRSSRSLLAGAVCALPLCAAPLPAATQQPPVGAIDRIAEILGGNRERKIGSTTELVRVRRGSDVVWLAVGPRSLLLPGDSLRVQPYVDAQLRVDRPTHHGDITFLAELLREGRGRVFEGDPAPEHGSYAVRAGEAGTDQLRVEIDRGAVVVDWDHGPLTVVAAGTETSILGTRLAIAVDATGDEGWLYLESGSVAFPAFPDLGASAGDLVRLVRGAPPAVSRAEPSRARQLRDVIDYNDARIWSDLRPFWQKPAFYLPAGGLAAGGVYLAVTAGGDDDARPPVGLVIVSIPF